MQPELPAPDADAIANLSGAIAYLSAAIATVATIILKKATKRTSSISERLDEQHERLLKLENNSVNRADLEAVIKELHIDLKASFQRAHTRIDELYQVNSKITNR